MSVHYFSILFLSKRGNYEINIPLKQDFIPMFHKSTIKLLITEISVRISYLMALKVFNFGF